MMKKIIFILIFFSPGLFGFDFSFWKLRDSSLSPETFNRFVRPQAKAIVTGYYQLLSKLNPVNEDLIEIKNRIFDLTMEWKNWNKSCKLISDDCIKSLKIFYEMTKALDQKILELQKKTFKLEFTTEEYQIDSIVMLSQTLDEMSNTNYKILHYVEQILITSNTIYFSREAPTDRFSPLLHQMLLSSEKSITSQLNKTLIPHFEFVWFHFIRNLEHHVAREGDRLYLLENIEDANLSWYGFYVKMLGENFPLPANTKPLIETIHNGWNAILRTILD